MTKSDKRRGGFKPRFFDWRHLWMTPKNGSQQMSIRKCTERLNSLFKKLYAPLYIILANKVILRVVSPKFEYHSLKIGKAPLDVVYFFASLIWSTWEKTEKTLYNLFKMPPPPPSLPHQLWWIFENYIVKVITFLFFYIYIIQCSNLLFKPAPLSIRSKISSQLLVEGSWSKWQVIVNSELYGYFVSGPK